MLVGLRMYVIDGVYKKIRDDWCSPIPSCGEEGHQRCAVCDAMVKNLDGINGAELHLAPDNHPLAMSVPRDPPRCTSLQVIIDLCEEWHLLWLDGATIYKHIFVSRGLAVGFIENFWLASLTQLRECNSPHLQRGAS